MMTISKFKAIVWRYYRAHGRHDLPWRGTRDIYKILVSEVMLHQTQVNRVLPFYIKFIKKFPTPARLASSSLASVLQTWQGLGYNRRAKMLHQAAKRLATQKKFTIAELESLPGVGHYTARAAAAFAYNEDVVFVETNIRTAIIHHFFRDKKKVPDKKIEKVLKHALPRGNAGEWYSALMDYGASLKKSGIQLNAKSTSYTKQSKFAGSLRQARGALLRAYTQGVTSRARLLDLLGPSRRAQMKTALNALITEGLIT